MTCKVVAFFIKDKDFHFEVMEWTIATSLRVDLSWNIFEVVFVIDSFDLDGEHGMNSRWRPFHLGCPLPSNASVESSTFPEWWLKIVD